MLFSFQPSFLIYFFPSSHSLILSFPPSCINPLLPLCFGCKHTPISGNRLWQLRVLFMSLSASITPVTSCSQRLLRLSQQPSAAGQRAVFFSHNTRQTSSRNALRLFHCVFMHSYTKRSDVVTQNVTYFSKCFCIISYIYKNNVLFCTLCIPKTFRIKLTEVEIRKK